MNNFAFFTSPYASYIIAAYGVAFVIIVWLVAGSVRAHRKAKAALSQLESHDA